VRYDFDPPQAECISKSRFAHGNSRPALVIPAKAGIQMDSAFGEFGYPASGRITDNNQLARHWMPCLDTA